MMKILYKSKLLILKLNPLQKVNKSKNVTKSSQDTKVHPEALGNICYIFLLKLRAFVIYWQKRLFAVALKLNLMKTQMFADFIYNPHAIQKIIK